MPFIEALLFADNIPLTFRFDDIIMSCMIFCTELCESFASASPDREGCGIETFGEFAEFGCGLLEDDGAGEWNGEGAG